MIEKREDPEKILGRVQEAERRSTKGSLKIYLGAAPGVGKTHSMLEDAIAKRAQGLDVIVGVVETHGRQKIEDLLKSFEILPKQRLEYREKKFLEFDLKTALKRNPGLILIDEMAHTNIPGLGHEKRWQDIKELLDRGIDIYTTLNVQHIESLNDRVSRILHAPIHETVPDSMVAAATTIELVDLSPEDLLRRLEEGKVYFPKQIEHAKENFFRKGNLVALRELALRVTAEHVNIEVLLYRAGEGIKDIWSTKENILVCVGAGIGSLKLIRMGRQLATKFQTKWTALYVASAQSHLSEKQRDEAIRNLHFAEQLGAHTRIISGVDVVEEIINFAQEHNITLIMTRKQVRSRWANFFRKQLSDEIIRSSGEINVYVMSEPMKVDEPKRPAIGLFWQWPASKTYGLVMGLVGLTMLMGFTAHYFSLLNVNHIIIIGVLGPIIAALIIGRLLTITQRQTQSAHFSEHQMVALHELSRQLASVRGVEKLLEVGTSHIAGIFQSNILALLPKDTESNDLIVRAKSGQEQALSDNEQSINQWVYDLGQMAGLGTDNLPFSEALYVPLLASGGTLGVLRVRPLKTKLFTPEQINLLQSCANQLALALEADNIQEQAKKMELQAEVDHIRSALLQYIAQDIETPLEAIFVSATTLKDASQQLESSDILKLGDSIYTETQAVKRLVNNLSQITYLESGSLKLQKSLCSVIDLVLRANIKKLEKFPVTMAIPEDFPKLHLDSLLMQHVFTNLIDNAIKFSTPNTPIIVSAALEQDKVVVRVQNQGAGIPLDEVNKVFNKFYRGKMVTTERGLGLGLSICRKIIEAHGGDIWVENGGDEAGAILRFTLPLSSSEE